MDGDCVAHEPKVFGSSRSNIPRPTTGRAPQPSPAVKAARNLKRKSIDHLSHLSATQAKKSAFSSGSSALYKVSAPLPDSARTGRATLATPSSLPRYLQTTAASARRAGVGNASRIGAARAPPSMPNRRSLTPVREDPICAQLRSEKEQLKGENTKLNAELTLIKNQITLQSQNLEMMQSSMECLQQTLAMKDTRFNAVQAALEVERSKSEALQAEVERKDAENAKLSKENAQLTSQLAESRDELRQKDEDLRALHNAVVDLKGQIRVAVRVRPPIGKELDAPINHLEYPGISSIKIDKGKGAQTFEFQRVFGPNMNQTRVFNEVEELILSCLHGYNVSIIAYGQTGSGKTYTMRGGYGDLEGIIPRAVKFLFQSRDKLADLDWSFNFKASFLEVYNEEVYDLLGERKKLDIKLGTGTTAVAGLKYQDINTLDDIELILAITDKTRSTAATKCNEQSSRSHAVFELAIHGYNGTSGATRHACLHLVDLAGSERVKESGAEGDRFKELTHINSALSNLQNCIRCQLNKEPHIPYRNSKLTMLLRDSLGAGSSKTMVIVNLNPAVTQIAETRRSLEFAQKMSITKIGSAKKQEQ
ncbi:hypothetical protein Q1695_001827 [Nippostrongylus brasiliensis]|nr:hypothetical protein Q1695_001827 [Nippostrongylus brasiliensis]